MTSQKTSLILEIPRVKAAQEMPADLDLRRTLRAIWNGTKNPPAGGARDLTARILSRRNRSVGSQHSPSQARGCGPPGACMLLQRQHRLWVQLA